MNPRLTVGYTSLYISLIYHKETSEKYQENKYFILKLTFGGMESPTPWGPTTFPIQRFIFALIVVARNIFHILLYECVFMIYTYCLYLQSSLYCKKPFQITIKNSYRNILFVMQGICYDTLRIKISMLCDISLTFRFL